MKSSPGTAPAGPDHLGRGIAFYQEGSYEEALAELSKARLTDPKSASAAFYLGATLKRMQDFAKAVPNLKDATTLQPPVKEAFPELADAYFALGKNDEALHALEVAEREGIEPGQTAFLKGMVLMKKRKYPEAVGSFDRAKSLDPSLESAADFQVATVFHRQGEQEKALERFNAVAAKDPESDVGQMAKQQAEALSRRVESGKAFNAVLSVQEQYDSNVILKPDNVAAAESISNQSDLSTVVSARLEYARPYSLSFGVKAQYALYLNAHQDLKEYDIQSHSIGLVPTWQMGENSLALLASYNYTLVDNSKYLQAVALSPLYVYTPSDGQQAHFSLRYQQKDFLRPVDRPDENRDATNLALGVSWFWLFSQQKGFVNLRAEVDRDDTQGANWSYLGGKIAAGALYPVTERLKASVGAEIYNQAYDNVNTAFEEKRTDLTTTATVQALYRLTSSIDAHLQFVYMKDDSTIDVYSFDKYTVGLGLFARF